MTQERRSEMQLVIASNDVLARRGLQAMLQEVPGYTVHDTCTLDATGTMLEKAKPHVLVAHITSKWTESPLVWLNRLRRQHPRVRIVAVTLPQFAPELLAAGADAALTQDEEQALIPATLAAYAHRSFVSYAIQEYLDIHNAARTQYRLTRREIGVLELLGQGCETKQIAVYFGIGPRSVQNYIGRIRSKLGGGNRTYLASWYQTLAGGTASVLNLLSNPKYPNAGPQLPSAA